MIWRVGDHAFWEPQSWTVPRVENPITVRIKRRDGERYEIEYEIRGKLFTTTTDGSRLRAINPPDPG